FKYANYVLKSGGVLAITLPNGGSLWTKVGKKRWSMFSLPEHLNYFDPKTMKMMLTKHGFETIELKSVSGEVFYSFYTMLSYFLPEPSDLPAHGGVNDDIVDKKVSRGKAIFKRVIGVIITPVLWLL